MELRSWGSCTAPSVCTFCLALCSPACSQFFCLQGEIWGVLSTMSQSWGFCLSNAYVLKAMMTECHISNNIKPLNSKYLATAHSAQSTGTNPLSTSVFWNRPLFSWGFISRLRHGSRWRVTELAGTEKEFIKRSWSKTLVRTKLGSH